MAEVRILAIDGGGIRGLIPAIVLQHIEATAGKPISELFHMIAGTSTGSILATGLSADGSGQPVADATRLRWLYENRGGRIFRRNLWKRIESVGGLLGEKYDSRYLREEVEAVVGSKWLSDIETDLIVTSYDLEKRRPNFFKSWRARGEMLDFLPEFSENGETAEDRDFKLVDVLVAAAAVPAFFEPVSAFSRSGKDTCLVDGGVFANNPAMCGYSAAKRIYNNSHDIFLVSLGTGKLERPIDCDDAKDWGLVEWVRPILEVVFDGVSDVANYHLRLLLDESFQRLQIGLEDRGIGGPPAPNDDFDDASDENIARLVARGELLLAESAVQVQAVVDRLTATPKAPRDVLVQPADSPGGAIS